MIFGERKVNVKAVLFPKISFIKWFPMENSRSESISGIGAPMAAYWPTIGKYQVYVWLKVISCNIEVLAAMFFLFKTLQIHARKELGA